MGISTDSKVYFLTLYSMWTYTEHIVCLVADDGLFTGDVIFTVMNDSLFMYSFPQLFSSTTVAFIHLQRKKKIILKN